MNKNISGSTYSLRTVVQETGVKVKGVSSKLPFRVNILDHGKCVITVFIINLQKKFLLSFFFFFTLVLIMISDRIISKRFLRSLHAFTENKIYDLRYVLIIRSINSQWQFLSILSNWTLTMEFTFHLKIGVAQLVRTKIIPPSKYRSSDLTHRLRSSSSNFFVPCCSSRRR